MPTKTQWQRTFTTIVSGDTVSGSVGVGNARLNAIWSPVVDSCQIFIRGAFDQSSANFVRTIDTNLGAGGSGYSNDFKWSVGPGSEMLIMHAAYHGAPYMKIETDVSQTDTRTFALIMSFE